MSTVVYDLEEKKRNYMKLKEKLSQESKSKSKVFKSTAQMEKEKADSKWTMAKVLSDLSRATATACINMQGQSWAKLRVLLN